MKTTTYTPDSVLRNPARLFREMGRDLMLSRELAWRLALRDIKAQYRQSILGYLWAFLPPLVVALPFILLNKSGTIDLGETQIPYAAYAMTGMILWQTFVEALNGPLRAVTANRAMLVKINFPRESLILSGVIVSLFNTAIRLFLLVPILIVAQIPFATSMFLFPIGLLALIALGLCIGILFTPLGMLYRDVERGLMVIISGWLFLTPVVIAPAKEGLAGTLMRWNPVTHVLVTARDWLTGITPAHMNEFILVMITTLAFLLLGWFLYRIALPHIIARLGM